MNINVQVWGKHVGGTCNKTNHRRSKPERGIKRTWENMKKNSLIKQIRDIVELRWGSATGFVEHSDVVWNPCVLGILELVYPPSHRCKTTTHSLRDPTLRRSLLPHSAMILVRVTCRVVGPNGEAWFVTRVESRLPRAFNTCFRTSSECTIDLQKIVE